jgi:uncharacterized protein with PIN domain
MPSGQAVKFLCDQNLGRLAKWLRLMGFDTIYMSTWDEKMIEDALAEQRMILTRRKDMKLAKGHMLIKDNDVRFQLSQVVNAFHLDELKNPLSRCILCNKKLHSIDRAKAKDRVPEYVYLTYDLFSECPSCEKVYWKGTHTENALAIIHKY